MTYKMLKSAAPFMSLGILLVAGAIAQSPGDDAAEIQSLCEGGRYVEAYERARRAAVSQPRDVTILSWLGVSARQNGLLEESLKAYQRSLELKPDQANVLNEIADLYASQENWDTAIEYYQRTLTVDPRLSRPWAGLGDVYRKNAAWAKAAECYTKAVGLNQDDVLSKSYLEACSRAEKEEAAGVLSAETLRRLSSLTSRMREQSGQSRTRGLDVRGLKEASEPARLAFHVVFPRNKYAIQDLSDKARAQLAEVATVLGTPEWQGKPLVLEGHTCSCGPASFNMSLGRKRADAVLQYVVAQQVLRPGAASIASKGESNPLMKPSKEDLNLQECERDPAHSANRRVIIKERRASVPQASTEVSFWYRTSPTSEFRRLVNGAVLYSGQEIRVHVRSYQPMYAYVFHHGSAGDWTQLFPNPMFSREAPARNPLEPERDYWLPAAGAGIPLDSTPGVEETFVYMSPGPDPEMEKSQAPGQPPAEIVKKIKTRGLKEVPVNTPEATYLPPRWVAHVRFEHRQ